MNGMEMMLKSFGFDPKQIQSALAGTVQAIQTFDARLRNIEAAVNNLTASTVKLIKVVESGNTRNGNNGNASGGNTSCDSTSGNGNGCGTDTSGSVDGTSGSGGSGS